MKIIDKLNEKRAYILESLKNGASFKQLGEEFNCNSGTIYYFAEKHGVKSQYKRSANYGKAEEYKDEIIKLFKEGKSAYRIGKDIGRTKTFVLKWLNKWGYDTSSKRTRNYNKPMLKDQYVDVIDMYLKQMMSTYQIGKQLGYSESNVWKLLKDHDIDTRTIHKYNCNINWLDKIDSIPKAQFLGLFTADGCTSTDRICIGLQDGDRSVLEYFKEEFEYEGPLYEIPPKNERCQPQVCLSIARKPIVDAITKLGCPQAKSYKVRFPSFNIVPEDLMSAFLQGNILGDGHIKKCINITSNYHFIKGWENFVLNNLRCHKTNIYQQSDNKKEGREIEDSTCTLSYSRREDYIPLGKYIYYSYHTKLHNIDRKYKIFEKLLSEYKRSLQKSY